MTLAAQGDLRRGCRDRNRHAFADRVRVVGRIYRRVLGDDDQPLLHLHTTWSWFPCTYKEPWPQRESLLRPRQSSSRIVAAACPRSDYLYSRKSAPAPRISDDSFLLIRWRRCVPISFYFHFYRMPFLHSAVGGLACKRCGVQSNASRSTCATETCTRVSSVFIGFFFAL
jgi:hypothetical protein